MLDISLTTFVDFVIKTGTPRLTAIKRAKKQYIEGYSPATDYWRALREAIVELHIKNSKKASLDRVLKKVSMSKAGNYSKCIEAYKRWLGNKRIKWIGCTTSVWSEESLSVRVNPELGLKIDDTKYFVKLYFKAGKPSKQKIDTILYLIQTKLPERYKYVTPAVLDVQRSKLFCPTREITGIDALLAGEASAFVTMWDKV